MRRLGTTLATCVALLAVSAGGSASTAWADPGAAAYSASGAGGLSFTPALTPSGAGSFSMTLQLASEVGHGPATGTLSISGALTGGCLTGSGAGVGSITWADGSNPSWGSFSVQLVGTLLYLQGFVDTGTFANDVPQGVFSLAPDEPAACAGPGVSTASLTGQVGFATPS